MSLKASDNNSSFIIATCALCAFLLSFFSSLSIGNEVSSSLLRASIALLIGAILGKFFLSMLYSISRDIRSRKRAELNKKKMEELARQEMEDGEMLEAGGEDNLEEKMT